MTSKRSRSFVQEARAASALNHPNIVTIHAIESADGVDFLSWSPDGKLLAYAAPVTQGGVIHLLDMATHRAPRVGSFEVLAPLGAGGNSR